MKNVLHFILAVLFMALLVPGKSQAQEPSPWQVGLFGGVSVPLGTYRGDTAQANPGYMGGVFADYFFGQSAFGIGLDARFLQHPIRHADSLFFRNGYIATDYHNARRFQHIGVALGPTYRFQGGKFGIDLFAKGGVLFQHFPAHTRELVYELRNAMGGMDTHSAMVQRTANVSNRAMAWYGVGGLRVGYQLAPSWRVFLQADYLTAFGNTFGGKSSRFTMEERIPLMPLSETDFVENPYEYFFDKPEPRHTFTQAANGSIGIAYTFGSRRKAKQKPQLPAAPAQPALRDEKPETLAKDIVVVVKDKQTGLALGGVKVVVVAEDGTEHVSFTDANGKADDLRGATPGNYRIHGEKNGISATSATVPPNAFEGSGTVIYRELLHDDPRFTLVGETVECDTEVGISGINTTLTNEDNAGNISQVSDANGKFIYQLEARTAYNVVANQAGKYSQTERVTTVGLDRSKTLYVTLRLGVCNLEAGAAWVVKNILYDFDKSHIRHDAALVLDNVANILKENPTLRIELSSHTDSRGNDAYNLALSQRRAESAVSYLVSKGIARDRMVARGYGETRLRNECSNGVDCPESQHEQNRRTEINVLSY